MKIAIVQDSLSFFGGAAKVAITLAQAFDADLYVAKYSPEKTFAECKKFKIHEINPTGEIPLRQLYAFVRMMDAFKFSRLKKLGDYDAIIMSGQWAQFAAKQNPNNIWYCHSPNPLLYEDKIAMRYNLPSRILLNAWGHLWAYFDRKYVKGYVKKVVVNSQNTAEKVRRVYGRDSEVVYPSVSIKGFYHKPSEDYYLSIARPVPEKRVDLQLRIFEKLPEERLIIVGKAEPDIEYQRMIARWVDRMPNVKWLRNVSTEELIELYARCKAVIQTSIEEDFGIVPIEAMAAGKPCIAVNEGGFKESIVNGKTGLLIEEPYVENFVAAIKQFGKYQFDPLTCRKRAELFSEEAFIVHMKEVIEKDAAE